MYRGMTKTVYGTRIGVHPDSGPLLNRIDYNGLDNVTEPGMISMEAGMPVVLST